MTPNCIIGDRLPQAVGRWTKAEGGSLARRKACFLLAANRGGGRVLPGGASLPYRSVGVLRKKFAEILEDFGICPARMQPRCSGRRLLLCDKPPTGQAPVSTANSTRRVRIVRQAIQRFEREAINTRTDFDYHRTNDGQRDGDDAAPQGSPLCEPER